MYIYMTLCFSVLFSEIQTTHTFKYTEFDMNESCNRTQQEGIAAQVRFKASSFYGRKQCKATFKAYAGDGYGYIKTNLMLGVKAVAMNIPCYQGAVILHHLSDYDRTLCGDSSSVTYRSFGDELSVEVKNIDKLSSSASFKLIFTILNYNTSISCGPRQFTCDNLYCIDHSIKCDGYNNCGDDSDEGCFWTAGSISGIAIGGIGLLVFIAVGLFVYRRRYRTPRYVRQPAMASNPMAAVSLPTISTAPPPSHCHQNVQHINTVTQQNHPIVTNQCY